MIHSMKSEWEAEKYKEDGERKPGDGPKKRSGTRRKPQLKKRRR